MAYNSHERLVTTPLAMHVRLVGSGAAWSTITTKCDSLTYRYRIDITLIILIDKSDTIIVRLPGYHTFDIILDLREYL